MSEELIYRSQEWMYSFTKDAKNNYFLEVVCGGIAMEMVKVKLTSSEVLSYQEKGRKALDELAVRILKNRTSFADRT